MSCSDLIQSLITKEVISSLCYVLAGIFLMFLSIYFANKTAKLYKNGEIEAVIPFVFASVFLFFLGLIFLITNIPSTFAPKAAVYEEHQKDIPTQCLFAK